MKKVFFGMGEKAGFNVFLESSILLKTQTYSAFSNTAIAEKCMLKKQKIMKNCGLVLNMAKDVFCFGGLLRFWFVVVGCVVVVFLCILEVSIVFWFVFCVFGNVANVLRMFFFFLILGAFWGGLFLFI